MRNKIRLILALLINLGLLLTDRYFLKIPDLWGMILSTSCFIIILFVGIYREK